MLDSLEHSLIENPWITSVKILEEIDSTNRVAKELAADGVPEGTLVVAKRQSMGRGRLGRRFFSPEGGIYMSMVLRPELSAEKAVLLTTCTAVAVARAIENTTGLSAGIKWVNDIFVNGKKVCGILAEAGLSGTSNVPEYVVLGIGINVERQSVPEELKEIVGCLENDTEGNVSKEQLIEAVWKEFAVLYQELEEASYMEEYRARSVLVGKTVTVLTPEGGYPALVKDIDREGHLIVEGEKGVEILSNGEVSVRL